ncbi:MAG TPA: histidine phosphotransferase family protein [Alphaproteobacteria bacterium]
MPDLRLCELLAARICHDLVGPIGAISNGIELLDQDGGTADAEVVKLIGSSARAASRRLQAYRVAFGSANTLPGAGCIGAVRELALALAGDGKVTIDWPAPAPEIDAQTDKRVAKLILNLVIIALDCMPRGGVVRVEFVPVAKGMTAAVHCIGGPPRLTDEVRAGLEGVFDLDVSTPKAAPAYVAACLAREVGAVLTITGDPANEFGIRVSISGRS